MEWLGEKLFGGIVRKFSISTHHYLYDFEGPHKETRSHACLVEFVLVKDEEHLVALVPKTQFATADGQRWAFVPELAAKMKEGQRAIIMNVSIRFASNETCAEQVFVIKNMFQPELGRISPPPAPPLDPPEDDDVLEEEMLEDAVLVEAVSQRDANSEDDIGAAQEEEEEEKGGIIAIPDDSNEGEEEEDEEDYEYAPHPDKTGEAGFSVPPKMRKAVPKDDQTVYEPNLINLEGINVLMYAGMEKLIMHPRSSILPQTAADILGGDGPGTVARAYEVFKAGDPAAVFIIQHRNDEGLGATSADVIEQKGEQGEVIYIISKAVLSRVRSLFKTAIFPLLNYTRFENVILEWVRPDRETCVELYEKHREALESECPESAPSVVMLFSVDYMVVTPNQPMYKAKSIDLGL